MKDNKIDFVLVGDPAEPEQPKTEDKKLDALDVLTLLAQARGEAAASAAMKAMLKELEPLPGAVFVAAAAAAHAKIVWSLNSTGSQMEQEKPGYMAAVHSYQDQLEDEHGDRLRTAGKAYRAFVDALKKAAKP